MAHSRSAERSIITALVVPHEGGKQFDLLLEMWPHALHEAALFECRRSSPRAWLTRAQVTSPASMTTWVVAPVSWHVLVFPRAENFPPDLVVAHNPCPHIDR
eukprot:CAMPEP_0183371772 /NCGR_PEP_ID=MMETSP0164_2-20130417/106394_1 /TAXON_ID=221442 /ORGANISM="Coccolithus pelagicus ssp braarudi, Strain PLY182g" /LENGTH=101 /DNA_ID=CAMNT_0025548373 /DNA_START=221 /DNA_END=526 /DNA_ORIENTATION=+